MIRLTAHLHGELFAFTVTRDDVGLFTTNDPVEAAERMLELGIGNPLHLIDAARQWGVVEIREDANPDWRGG